jgi:hypothetical protein
MYNFSPQSGPRDAPMHCFIRRNKSNSTFYLYLSLTHGKYLCLFPHITFVYLVSTVNCQISDWKAYFLTFSIFLIYLRYVMMQSYNFIWTWNCFRYCQISSPYTAVTFPLSVLGMTCDVEIFLPASQSCLENRVVLLVISHNFLVPSWWGPVHPILVTHQYQKETFSYLNRIVSRKQDDWVVGRLASYFNFELNTYLVVMTSYLLDLIPNSSFPACNFKV